MSTWSFRLVFGFAFGLLACTAIGGGQADTAAPTPSTPAAPVATPSADALVACTVDADCVVVEMGCCDHCNGGALMSIAKDNKDAAMARWHATDCNDGCTERACDWHEAPVCDAGTCAQMRDRWDDKGNVTRVLVRNAPR
jgi:hypothetical protein